MSASTTFTLQPALTSQQLATNSVSSTLPDSLLVRTRRLFSSSSFEGIPLLLFALYVVGFLCLNTHLSRFPIVEGNLLSFNYIKASLMFFIFNIILIGTARKIARELNNNRLNSNILIMLFIVNAYCLVFFLYELLTLSFLEQLSDNDEKIKTYIILYTYFPIAFTIFFHKTQNKQGLFLLIALTFINIAIFCINSVACRVITGYVIASLFAYYTIFYIDYNKRDLYTGNLGLFVPCYGFVLALVIIGFGAFVYDKIPQVIGGGKSYKATLYLTKSELQILRECCILDNDVSMQQQVNIIYSSDKGFYIDDREKVVIVPIDAIKGIKVKRWLWLTTHTR